MNTIRYGKGRRCDVCGSFVFRQRGYWVRGEFRCYTCHKEILNGVLAGSGKFYKQGGEKSNGMVFKYKSD